MGFNPRLPKSPVYSSAGMLVDGFAEYIMKDKVMFSFCIIWIP